MWLLLILIQISISASVKHVDYCSLCSNHVACRARKQFGPNCIEPRMIPIKRCWVLRRHNEVRNTAAGGFNEFKPACRMAYMQWDEELADLAEYQVRKCVFEHDECHDTVKFPNSGQNLGYTTFIPEDDFNATFLVTKVIDLWTEERNDTQQSNIDKFGTPARGVIGHYTVMINERSTHVGCAAATYKDPVMGMYKFELICNYAHNNFLNEAVYESCSTPGMKCRHPNEEYKNLCCPHEYEYEDDTKKTEETQNQHPKLNENFIFNNFFNNNNLINNNNAKPTDNKYRQNPFLKTLKPCRKEEDNIMQQFFTKGSSRHFLQLRNKMEIRS